MCSINVKGILQKGNVYEIGSIPIAFKKLSTQSWGASSQLTVLTAANDTNGS